MFYISAKLKPPQSKNGILIYTDMEGQISLAEHEMAIISKPVETTSISDETIAKAEKQILLFSNPIVDSTLHKMDDDHEQIITFDFSSPSGNRKAEFVGTTHSHDLSEADQQKQEQELVEQFTAYIQTQQEKGGKSMLMIEGGGVINYTSLEEAKQKAGEFAPLIWMAQKENVPVYSPDTTPEDTTVIMKHEGYPDETIAFLECFKTLHSKVREKTNNDELNQFTQVELANLLAGVAERIEWQEKLPLVTGLKETVNKKGLDDPESRKAIADFIEGTLDGLNRQFQLSTKAIDEKEGFPLFQSNGVDENGFPVFTTLYDPKEHYQTLLRPDTHAPDNPKTPMNRLSNELGELRERHVFKNIVEKIKVGYDPFIAFGNSHAIKESPAIEQIYNSLV